MPRAKKPPGEAVRRNKESQYREMGEVDGFVVPELPAHPGGGGWAAETVRYWDAFWGSPFQSELIPELDAITFVPVMLAHDRVMRIAGGDFADWKKPPDLGAALSELRLQEKSWGVRLLDRRSLGVVPRRGGPKGVVQPARSKSGKKPDPRVS